MVTKYKMLIFATKNKIVVFLTALAQKVKDTPMAPYMGIMQSMSQQQKLVLMAFPVDSMQRPNMEEEKRVTAYIGYKSASLNYRSGSSSCKVGSDSYKKMFEKKYIKCHILLKMPLFIVVFSYDTCSKSVIFWSKNRG